MKSYKYREIVEKFFNRSFPGSEFFEEDINRKMTNYVSRYKGDVQLLIRGIESKNCEFQIKRNPGFSDKEFNFIKCFIESLSNIASTDDSFIDQIWQYCVREAIVKSISNNESQRKTLLDLINILESWSSQTYEGGSITASFLVRDNDTFETPLHLNDYASYDFSKVLSNGFDTCTVISSSGYIAGYDVGEMFIKTNHVVPFRYTALSYLTQDSNHIMILLNRNADLLIIVNDELRFAKRRGVWLIFDHETIIRQLSISSKIFTEDLRREIYASALDVSFARTGGCLAYIQKTDKAKFDFFINKGGDKKKVDDTDSNVGVYFNMDYDKEYSRIDRRVRQEYLAIDGSNIISHDGKLISAGRIIDKIESIPGKGGRYAAASKLAEYGASLKISEDGEITVFKSSIKNKEDRKVFSFA